MITACGHGSETIRCKASRLPGARGAGQGDQNDFSVSMELRREINERLNVIENWNGANDFIYFGKGGEMASNRADDQEINMLSLHLVQRSLVYVNTLMIQQVLAESAWRTRLNANDLRGITPLISGHVNPYGSFRLDLNSGCPSIHRASAHNPKAAPTRAEAWSK